MSLQNGCGAMAYHTLKGCTKLKPGMYEIIVDAWWLVDDDGMPLFNSKNRPMCNQHRSITERFGGGMQVKQIPVVYVPVNINDYVEPY